MMKQPDSQLQGILLVNKPRGLRSFTLVRQLRRHLNVQKIGHAGTLDPFATGVMVMLIGKKYTRMAQDFLNADKEYIATLQLGVETDSYDCDGAITSQSPLIPELVQIEEALTSFQGDVEQVPPMFSAKKQAGKKLYELAREGKSVERKPVVVQLRTTLLSYEYPYVKLHVACSKGTYVRSIAHDLGKLLGCGAHLVELERTRSGDFLLKDCLDGQLLDGDRIAPQHLITLLLKK